MDIKTNINKIDYDLKSRFRDVKILEKSSLKFGKHFEIEINESRIVKAIIPFRNIDGKSNFNWFYYSNPISESSDMIPRNSNVHDFLIHVEDVLINDRFSEDYKKTK